MCRVDMIVVVRQQLKGTVAEGRGRWNRQLILSLHQEPQVPLHEKKAEYDGWVDQDSLIETEDNIDLSLIERFDSTLHRLSTPYLHELKEKAKQDTVERDTKSKDELAQLIKPFTKVHPSSLHHAPSSLSSPPASQEILPDTRDLRNRHMKHVMAIKRKMEQRKKMALQHELSDKIRIEQSVQNTTVQDHELIKSPHDKRSYRFLTLSNGLRVVLISDPETTKSSAAMNVGNGYLSDPVDIPGMAHFLEHMLFLGTTKYPKESEYADFIEAHGGFSNAYTAMENTNYYFDILPPHLAGALDRFAQFFISPLLSVGATQREMNAVDAEHSKNLLSDPWRTNRLLQELANKTHPYHKFGTGCSKTLDTMPHDKMRERLLDFWNNHYTANNLQLSVLGQEDLDTLQTLIENTFADVRPSDTIYDPLANTTFRDVFPRSALKHQVYIKTIEDSKFFALIFPMESMYPFYKQQTLAYLKHFIEHRGAGSLQKQLKNKGWISSISFSVDAGTSAFTTVQFAAELTDRGTNKIPNIIEAFFEYLNTITKKGIHKWRYNELATLANLTFSLKDKEHPASYVSKLAANLRIYPPEDLLTGGRLFRAFSAKHIKHVLKRLKPDNMIVLIGGSKLTKKLPSREKWYNIEYAKEPIPKKLYRRYRRASSDFSFKLPKRNKFVQYNVTTFPLLDPPIATPVILTEQRKPNSHRLWYSQDVEFLRPHGHVVFRLYAPFIYASARNYLLTNIYVNLLEDHIDEELYPALIAGFSSHFRVGTCYLDLIFYGYNSGLLRYAKSVARIMNPVKGKFKPNQQRFNMYKEALLNNYLNKKFDAPHKQTVKLFTQLLDPKTISSYDMVNTLHQISFQDVASWAKVLFNDMSLEAFVHGNLYPSHAIALLNTFRSNLPFNTTTASFANSPTRNHVITRPRLGRVMENYAVVQHAPNPAETNSAILNYWQFGMASLEYKLYAQMLSLIVQKPCFHQLRTIEQLGYIVWSSVDVRLDVYGFRIVIQSGKKDAGYLNERIVKFVAKFQETLANLTQKQFETYVETLMMTKLEAPISMAMQTSWFWNEIAKQEYIFNRKELELYLLNQTNFISREGFQQFVKKLFYISDPANAGIESCETMGGGMLSVRIESPVVRNDTAATPAANATADATATPTPAATPDAATNTTDTSTNTTAVSALELGHDHSKAVEVSQPAMSSPQLQLFQALHVDLINRQRSGLFLLNNKQDLAPLDPEVLVLITVRTGQMFLLNITQSTIHTFTDSLQLYPRNKYMTPSLPLDTLPDEPTS